MNRKSGDQLAITAIAAASLGAAVLAMAPQAIAQKKAAAPKGPAAPSTFRDCPTCPEMVRLPGGSFTMGSPTTEPNRNDDEGPPRTVTVKPFAVGKFEITFDEWDACVMDGGCAAPPGGLAARPATPSLDPNVIALLQQSGGDAQAFGLLAAERGIPRDQIAAAQALLGAPAGQGRGGAAGAAQQGQGRGGGGAAQAAPGRGGAAASPISGDPGGDAGFGRGKRPAVNISWKDAQAYVTWLSKKTGKTYRLLTEAEWEYATRAGTKTPYFWGDKGDEGGGRDFANYEGTNGKDTFGTNPGTAPVGTFNPNPWGLYDTIGNASEWVQDCYSKSLERAPADGSAVLQGDCTLRVLRGASWASSEELHRAANRDWVLDTYRSSSTGFRVARAP